MFNAVAPAFFQYILEHNCFYHAKFGDLQEKELIERHNVWLNDELTEKVDSLIGLRKTHADVEADLSSKLADVCIFYSLFVKHSSFLWSYVKHTF